MIRLMMRLTEVGGGFLRDIDARRHLSGVCSLWYLVARNLHRFFIAIARAAVNDDDFGGTAIDPCVRSAGSVPKRRKVSEGVRGFAMLLGPPSLWEGSWSCASLAVIGAGDVAFFCGSAGEHCPFRGSLHWPSEPRDPGVGGVSYLELLILYELWAVKRLVFETAVPGYLCGGQFQCRLFLWV